ASGTVSDVLRLPLAAGRSLQRDDERPDHPPVAVITTQLWEERFSRDPQIVGRAVVLGGTQYTIVGVFAASAVLPTADLLSESLSLSSTFAAIVPLRLDFNNVGWMGQFNYPVVGRLAPGATLDQARAELDVIQRSVAQIAARET